MEMQRFVKNSRRFLQKFLGGGRFTIVSVDHHHLNLHYSCVEHSVFVDSKIIVGCLDNQTWLDRSQSEAKDKNLFALDDHDQIIMIGKDHDYHGFRDLSKQWKGDSCSQCS